MFRNSISHGHVEVIAGCMFSGKSEELIRRLRRATIAKQGVQVFKPATDNRYATNAVVSHTKDEFPCTPLVCAVDVYQHLSDTTKVVGFDEAQFFEEDIVGVVERLANSGRRVIVAGLDLDAFAKPFGSMPTLLALAEDITRLHAVCVVCGGPASRSLRTSGTTQQVEVGAVQYEPRCREHFYSGDMKCLPVG